MSENALFIIFSSLKKFCGEDLDVHKKIAFISQFATELCFPTYFTDLSAQVKIYKSISINPVISVNIYDNPSFCSELIVSFKGKEQFFISNNRYKKLSFHFLYRITDIRILPNIVYIG